MNTINDLLSNFNFFNNHSTEKNEKNEKNDYVQNNINNESNNNRYANDSQIPSLSQGNQFKEYQNKISENIEKKQKKSNISGNINKNTEGFQSTSKTNNNDINSVRDEYNKTLSEYQILLDSISKSLNANADRTSSTNTYLNKLIRFTDSGAVYYVTNKGIAKYIPSPTILNSIAGKNGCPVLTYVNVTIPWSHNYNIPGQLIPTNPPLIVGTPMQAGASCGNEGSNVYVSNMIPNQNVQNQTYKGCFQDNTTSPSMTFIGDTPSTSTAGKYGFDQCKMAAIDKGYQYFALQQANETTGLGYCTVSNDLTASSKYGTAFKNIVLWSSNTFGKPVSYAILKKDGTLNVCDSNGKPFWTSPNGKNCEQVYSTTWNQDAPGNDISYLLRTTEANCINVCNNNPNCGGFAWNRSNNNSCWIKSGKLSNLRHNNQRILKKKTVDTSQCNYFLILQNDGNMCIYRGDPNKNLGAIWCTMTNGKQQLANTNYSVSKSKYGMTFIKNDQVLNKGDWILSADGRLLLIMQTDGNLVLYTFQNNCIQGKNTGNKFVGGVSANPIYDIGLKGILSDMGSIGFIDPNNELQIYPNSNTKYTDSYSSTLDGTTVNGNDIPATSFVNTKGVPSACMEACNKLDNCSGFVFDTTGPTPVCRPKSNTSYYGNKDLQTKVGNVTFIRDKTNITPTGIPKVNIDSVKYNNYTKFLPNNLNFNSMSLNSVQKNQLKQLESRLEQLSNQLKSNTVSIFDSQKQFHSNELDKFNQNFKNNVNDYHVTNSKIKNFDLNNNIENILKESDIKILQENYSYMFWSIIAITTVLVAINIKKQ